jgi:hypothetical protein
VQHLRVSSLWVWCQFLLILYIFWSRLEQLDSNNILYDLQNGFRKARSCESQLLQFIQELNANNNKNIQTDLIIMDFAKAFDKVSHRRLLYKLKYYGTQTHTLNWIRLSTLQLHQGLIVVSCSRPDMLFLYKLYCHLQRVLVCCV